MVKFFIREGEGGREKCCFERSWVSWEDFWELGFSFVIY